MGFGARLLRFSLSNLPKQSLAFHGDGTVSRSTVKELEFLKIELSIAVCKEENCFLIAE
jgi:mannose-1-phosphate guanylyltransferase